MFKLYLYREDTTIEILLWTPQNACWSTWVIRCRVDVPGAVTEQCRYNRLAEHATVGARQQRTHCRLKRSPLVRQGAEMNRIQIKGFYWAVIKPHSSSLSRSGSLNTVSIRVPDLQEHTEKYCSAQCSLPTSALRSYSIIQKDWGQAIPGCRSSRTSYFQNQIPRVLQSFLSHY